MAKLHKQVRYLILYLIACVVIFGTGSAILIPYLRNSHQGELARQTEKQQEREKLEKQMRLLQERIDQLPQVTFITSEQIMEALKETQAELDAQAARPSPDDLTLTPDERVTQKLIESYPYLHLNDFPELNLSEDEITRINRKIGEEFWLIISRIDAYNTLRDEMLILIDTDKRYDEQYDFKPKNPDSLYAQFGDITESIHSSIKSMNRRLDNHLYDMQYFMQTRHKITKVMDEKYELSYLIDIWWLRHNEAQFSYFDGGPFYSQGRFFSGGTNIEPQSWYTYQRAIPESESYALTYQRTFPNLGLYLLGSPLPALPSTQPANNN